MTRQKLQLLAATLFLLVAVSACTRPNDLAAMPSVLVTGTVPAANQPSEQPSSLPGAQTLQLGASQEPPRGDLTLLVTDLGLADTHIVLIHPSDLNLRLGNLDKIGDMIATGSLYATNPAILEKSRAQIVISLYSKPPSIRIDEWIKLRLEPLDTARSEQLPLGTATFRPASPLENISVRGHRAVTFFDQSWDIPTASVLVEDRDRVIIVRLYYINEGDGAMKPAFSTVVASLDWTRNPQEGFGRDLAIDQPLKQQLDDILAGYPSAR